MKVIAVIIYSVLVLQTSASFFDEVRGAVYSVENSFEKLLSDVIYDVRETIDCTLMAVEQVLALDVFGDPADYERRCGGAPAPAEQPAAAAPPPGQDTSRETSAPEPNTDSSILDVDQVLCDVLKKDDTHSQLQGVKMALKTETERLIEISELLRIQLDELSAEVRDKLKAIQLQNSQPSVETIWNDVKILQEIEHKHQNTAEAKKISHILDQILSILDGKEEDRTSADDDKVREIMLKLRSKGGTSDWKDGNDYPKDFREYANRIFEESSTTTSSDNDCKNRETDDEKKVNIREDTTVEPKSSENSTAMPKPKRHKTTTTTTTEKPLTIEELASEFGSLFDVMPDIESISAKRAVESAKNIIQDSEVNDMVMNSLDNIGSNKAARNVFDDPELLA